MARSDTTSAQFSLSQVGRDVLRVIAARWAMLALTVTLLGALPTILISIPWYQVRGGDVSQFHRIWTLVNFAKAVGQLLIFSAVSVAVTVQALMTLNPESGLREHRFSSVIHGLGTAFCLNVVSNWGALAYPFVVFLPHPYTAVYMLSAANLLTYLLVATLWLLAVPAAVSERRWFPSALGRSVRLQKRLRWMSLGLAVIYLLTVLAARAALATMLAAFGVPNVASPGPGLAAVNISAVLVAQFFMLSFVGILVQARRIADGPTLSEVGEIFA